MTSGQQIVQGLAKLGQWLRSDQNRGASRLGLSPLQGQLLVFVAERGPRTLGELAADAAVRAPTASEAVARLEAKGLVRKLPDPRDRRRVRVAATARGRRVAGRCRAWPELLATAVDTLAEVERGELLRLLTRMIGELQQRGAIPLQRMCASCVHFRPNVRPGTARPHDCAYLAAPLAMHDLTLDCPDHALADPTAVGAALEALASTAGETPTTNSV